MWNSFSKGLGKLEDATVLVLLAGTLLISFSQIVARWMGGGWVWADELVRYFVLWLGVFGAVVATRNQKHIAIDAFQHLMPRTPRLLIRRFINLVAGLIVCILIYASTIFLKVAEEEKVLTLDTNVATLTMPLLVALSLIAFRFIALAVFGENDETEVAA